jgi:MFS family permease
VGVAFLVDFIAVGFFFYSYGVFFKAIAADLGSGTRFGVSLGLSISNLVGAAAAPFIGRAIDRVPVKRIMIAGAICVSAGFGLLSQIAAFWQYYLVLGTLLGLGGTLMGGLASSKLVANWFVARRGTAFGIATVGISLSGLLMPTAATWLVATVGWRGGFAVYGVCTLAVVVPLVARFVVDRPEAIGLQPDGDDPPEDTTQPPRAADRMWRTGEILRSRNFWAIALPFALVLSALSAILVHLVPYADDLGIPAYRAAWVLSISAGMGVLGKIAFGWLFDRFDARAAVWLSFAMQLAGVLLLMRSRSYPGLLTAALVFGFGMGGVIPLHGSVAGAAFGRLSFGKVAGLLRPFQVPITALGVPLAGWIYDATGSYAVAFRIFAAVYVVAAMIVGGLRLGDGGPGAPGTDRGRGEGPPGARLSAPGEAGFAQGLRDQPHDGGVGPEGDVTALVPLDPGPVPLAPEVADLVGGHQPVRDRGEDGAPIHGQPGLEHQG